MDGGGGLVAKSYPALGTPWTVACQTPLSMGFSRQECWSGLPFPSPGDLPDPGIKPGSPALQVDSLLSEPPGKPCVNDGQVKEPLPLRICTAPEGSHSSGYTGQQGPGLSTQSYCSSAAKRDSPPRPPPIHPIPPSVLLSNPHGQCLHPTEGPLDQAKQETLTAEVR